MGNSTRKKKMMKITLLALTVLAVATFAQVPTPAPLPQQWNGYLTINTPTFNFQGAMYVDYTLSKQRVDIIAPTYSTMFSVIQDFDPSTFKYAPTQTKLNVGAYNNNAQTCNIEAAEPGTAIAPDALKDAKYIGLTSWFGTEARQWVLDSNDQQQTISVLTSVATGYPIVIEGTNSTTGDLVNFITFTDITPSVAPNTFAVPSIPCPSSSDSLAADAHAHADAHADARAHASLINRALTTLSSLL